MPPTLLVCPLGLPGDFLRADDGTRLAIAFVRMERLQSISDDDLEHEGGMWKETAPTGAHETARAGFARWWDDVHPRPEAKWERNPWVWVVDFERR